MNGLVIKMRRHRRTKLKRFAKQIREREQTDVSDDEVKDKWT